MQHHLLARSNDLTSALVFDHVSDPALKARCMQGDHAAIKELVGCHFAEGKAVNQVIDGESVRPCDNCWPDKALTNQQEAGAMGTGVNSRLEGPKARKVQDRKNAGGRLATKVNNAWTTALACSSWGSRA